MKKVIHLLDCNEFIRSLIMRSHIFHYVDPTGDFYWVLVSNAEFMKTEGIATSDFDPRLKRQLLLKTLTLFIETSMLASRGLTVKRRILKHELSEHVL